MVPVSGTYDKDIGCGLRGRRFAFNWMLIAPLLNRPLGISHCHVAAAGHNTPLRIWSCVRRPNPHVMTDSHFEVVFYPTVFHDSVSRWLCGPTDGWDLGSSNRRIRRTTAADCFNRQSSADQSKLGQSEIPIRTEGVHTDSTQEVFTPEEGPVTVTFPAADQGKATRTWRITVQSSCGRQSAGLRPPTEAA